MICAECLAGYGLPWNLARPARSHSMPYSCMEKLANMRQNLWMWHKYRMRGIRWPWVLRQKADRCLAGFQVKCGSFPPRLMPAPLPNLLLAIAPACGQPRGDPAIWFQIGDGVPCVRSDTLNTVWNDCQHRRPGRALRERMPAFGVTRHSSSAAVVLTSASLAVLLPPFDAVAVVAAGYSTNTMVPARSIGAQVRPSLDHFPSQRLSATRRVGCFRMGRRLCAV